MAARPGVNEVAFGSRSTPGRAGDPDVLEGLLGSVTCALSSVGWYAFPSGWAMPERALEWHIAYLCVDGALEITRSGAGATVVLGAGELYLTGAVERHRLANSGPGPLHLLTVHFTARIHDVLDMPPVYGLPGRSRPSPDGWSAMEAAVRRMLDELAARDPGSALAANAGCAWFVTLLWRESVRASGGRTPAVSSTASDLVRLAPVFRLIHERYADRPTLAQLAEVVHLDPDYFATVFKRVTGAPPLQYVAAFRLGRVRTLLAATDEPIGEIAARTGYSDAFYLSRAFRRAYGMSPSAYRKSRESPDLP